MATRKDRDQPKAAIQSKNRAPDRRSILLGGATLAAASALSAGAPVRMAQAQPAPTPPTGRKPNILAIFGDDIGGRMQTIIGVEIPQIDARYVMVVEPCEPVFDSARGCSRLPAAISAACPQ
jgi:hypothetical protein